MTAKCVDSVSVQFIYAVPARSTHAVASAKSNKMNETARKSEGTYSRSSND